MIDCAKSCGGLNPLALTATRSNDGFGARGTHPRARGKLEVRLERARLRRVCAPHPTHRLDGRAQPFAIILGCSDSCVPAEIVFDQGLGDLCVIRVAGNIVAPSQVGSVELAAARYDTRLVVVLGHSQCGTILATLDELRKPTEKPALAEAV